MLMTGEKDLLIKINNDEVINFLESTSDTVAFSR